MELYSYQPENKRVNSIKETKLFCNSCKRDLLKIVETDKPGVESKGFAVCPCGGESFYYKATNSIIPYCNNSIVISEIQMLQNGDQKIICQNS